jgi:uncharacterized protein with NRDE domain
MSNQPYAPSMCLIIFAHRAHPDYPLLVSANRDEYYGRPTDNAHYWPEDTGLLAGRDLLAGGTWLGITRTGRFAAITNHRNPDTTPQQPRSRGMLTLDFLRGAMSPADYLDQISQRANAYAGFNLLLGDGEELYYFSNIAGAVQRLEPGIYGVGNALLDTPWPKLLLGKEKLRTSLDGKLDHAALQAIISGREYAPDSTLPDTGLEQERERMLSAQFICSPSYGTRATTTLKVHCEGGIDFSETTYLANGELEQQQVFALPMATAK